MGRPRLPRPDCALCGQKCKTPDRVYCSYKCASHAHPPPVHHGNRYAFKGEAVTVWAQYKRMQHLCPAGPCEGCGAAGRVIHHRDHNPRNTVPDNLARLCRGCHINHHRAELRS